MTRAALPREMHELVKVLDQQARLTADSLPRLKAMKDLEEYWVECNRLENEGDRIARQAVAELFKQGQELIDVIKWKDVYALLEEAIDSAEDAANVIERIVVKHA